jgi:hypothetical protein
MRDVLAELTAAKAAIEQQASNMKALKAKLAQSHQNKL